MLPKNVGRQKSTIALLCDLVSHPSRAGTDSPEPVLSVISKWLRVNGVSHQWMSNAAGLPIGLYGEIQGGRPGPSYLLDATADTAPFGDTKAWSYPPELATIDGGWLYGRGSADSKAGIAVYCHVLADLLPERKSLAGTLGFVFDAEEHTGSFAGIRHYMAMRRGEPLDGVMIGYPGNDRLVTGARGFLRTRLSIHGVGAHSGSSGIHGVNAIERACALLGGIKAIDLPSSDETFLLPPKLTPTAIRSGSSFSLVPDLCRLELDIRLTPTFDDAAARALLETAVARLDADRTAPSTRIKWFPGWPAYQIGAANPMVQALTQSAIKAFGHEIKPEVAGPSSVANYLSTLGIPATAGLGVTYRGIHAPDECVLLETLEPTYVAYREALIHLLR